MIIVIISAILNLQSACTERCSTNLEIFDKQAISLIKSRAVCQNSQPKQEFFNEHLWPKLDWQIRGDLIFTNCVEKAIYCLEKKNFFALANLESVHLPRLIDAYQKVFGENLKDGNRNRFLNMQASFNLFKNSVEQYKKRYQICTVAQEICKNQYLPEEVRQDFVDLAKPEITHKSKALINSLALAIKTKYRC